MIDSHSHLHLQNYFPDVRDVIDRSSKAGVKGHIVIGCNIKDSLSALRFAEQNRNVHCVAGVHPDDSAQLDASGEQQLRDLIKDQLAKKAGERVLVGIGEIGLDYHENTVSPLLQKDVFIKQINLAKEFDLPIVIHTRDSQDDVWCIVEKERPSHVVFHSFSGGMREAVRAWERGYCLGFSGFITYPKNEKYADVIKQSPENLILVETDCPFLPPQAYRGKRNEPAYMVETLQYIADCRASELAHCDAITTVNTERFFRIES